MAFGFQQWNGSGALQLDVSSRLTRIIDWFYVAAGASGSTNYSAAGFSATRGAAFATKAYGTTGVYMPHTVSIAGSTVSWTPSATVPVGSHIWVIMYK
jgi:hypothetical protein